VIVNLVSNGEVVESHIVDVIDRRIRRAGQRHCKGVR